MVAKAERRRFTAEYKLKVLREAEDCQRSGEIGALLRREGLYWSNLTHWRKQRESETGGVNGEEKRPPTPGEKPVSRARQGIGAGQCAA